MEAGGEIVWAIVLASPLIGSFIGVVVERVPLRHNFLVGRSACSTCNHRLGARDLVPIISWLATAGRCRYCGAILGPFYPCIELAAIGVAAWSATVTSGWLLLATCCLGWLLLALAWIDWRHLVLPDALNLILVMGGLIVAYSIGSQVAAEHLLGVALGFAIFASISITYAKFRHREGLGMGDAKLLAGAGAWVSWNGLPSVVLYAAISGLTTVIIMSAFGKAKKQHDKIPFGPHLCLGIWFVWLYGLMVVS